MRWERLRPTVEGFGVFGLALLCIVLLLPLLLVGLLLWAFLVPRYHDAFDAATAERCELTYDEHLVVLRLETVPDWLGEPYLYGASPWGRGDHDILGWGFSVAPGTSMASLPIWSDVRDGLRPADGYPATLMLRVPDEAEMQTLVLTWGGGEVSYRQEFAVTPATGTCD